MKSGRPLLVVATILFLACVGSAHSQTPSTDDQLGFVPGLSYHGSNFDNISLSTGNLVVDPSLVAYPQRGGALKVDFHILLNGKRWVVKQAGCPGDGCVLVWSRSTSKSGIVEAAASLTLSDNRTLTSGHPPGCPFQYAAKYVLTTPDGARHPLGNLGSVYTATLVAGCSTEVRGTGPYVSLDGSGWRVPGDPTVVNTVIGPNGVRYSLTVGGLTTAAEDPNGNQITYGTTSITDTLGRTIPFPPDPLTGQPSNTTTDGCIGPLPVTYVYAWSPPGLGGGTVVYKFCYATVAISIPTSPDGTVLGRSASDILLQSVVLPNSRAWTFEYNDRDPGDPASVNYGNLTKITLPTGGTIAYGYQTGGLAGSDLGSRSVTSRTVDAQDGTGPHTWHYSYVPGSTTTVTNPPATTGSTSDEVVHTFQTPGVTHCGDNSFYETQAQYFSGTHTGGTLLKTVTTDYQTSCPFSLPVRVTTAWANGSTTKTETTYDSPFTVNEPSQGPATANYGVTTATSDFDFGSGAAGALLRTTATSYKWQSDQNYLNNNFLRLPGSVTVSDGGGSQVAQTTYGYDEYALNSSGISSQRDGSPANGSVRGNQTSLHRWLNGSSVSTTNCPIAVNNGFIVTYATYNDTGTINQSTGACGTSAGDPNHTTTFAYSSTFAGAYATSVTNALGQVGSSNYDLNTGLVLSRTDANQQTTTYSYDALQRPAQTNTPDGGQTVTCYTDTGGATCTQAAPPFKLVITKKIDSSRSLVSTAIIDGLGRKVESQLNSDPACATGTKIDTAYDSLGRVASVTNPFCASSDPTYGVTQYSYDALNRTTQLTRADGSKATTSYAGQAVEVTDEGNGTRPVQRISQTDALGRMASLCEVSGATLSVGGGATPADCGLGIAGTGFMTSYTYDLLNNLIAVSQGGFMPRSFRFDSLSRLTQTTNPESGTINYGYDANGNVVTRKDARNITTTYAYDVLNRLTTKCYSDGTTPTASFAYDACPAGGCPAGVTPQLAVGRMVKASTANTATTFSYDAVGRVAAEWQCTPLNCGSGNYALSFSYDANGDLTSQTNGLGVTLTNTFDAAARLTSVTSNLSDANHPANLLSSVQYNALGAVSAESLGNGINETFSYDQRGRLRSARAALPNGQPATGSVTISGTLQTYQQQTKAATPASLTVTIGGSDMVDHVIVCTTDRFGIEHCHTNTTPESGTVQFSVNVGGTVVGPVSASYNGASTTAGLAAALFSAFPPNSVVTMSNPNGSSSFTLTTLATGSSANGTAFTASIAQGCTPSDNFYCTGAGWTIAPATANFSGGQDAVYQTAYDNGSTTIIVNNHPDTYPWSGSGTTVASIAQGLCNAINNDNGAFVTANTNGIPGQCPLASTTVSLVARQSGAGTDYPLFASSNSVVNSFSVACLGFPSCASAALVSGGIDAYSFSLTYAPNSNVLSVNDSANGNWTYGYDDFNRLTSSNKNSGQQTYSYVYDRFGNRWQQNAPLGGNVFVGIFSSGNNRLDGANYDPAGNMTHDPTSGANYTYDAENRVISVNAGAVTYTYDAAGRRVEKNVGGAKTDYVYDGASQPIAEVNGSGAVTRQELFAGGKHLGTYVNNTTYFSHGDWLGTERARSDMAGVSCETIQSLPFGDGQSTSGGCGDPSTRHFTGKEGDAETSLAYFGARYYSSAMGRFVTPDWAAKAVAVPYADLADPQSLNLYSYVRNRPTVLVDPDGHEGEQPIVLSQVSQTTNCGDGCVLKLTETKTLSFNQDGSADLTTTTTGSISRVDPNTGESLTTPITPLTSTTSIDRANDSGRITVDGKVAPRSWGDNIKDVANTIATGVDPHGSLIHNGGEVAGNFVDFMRSKEGQELRYNYLKGQLVADQAMITIGDKILNGIKNLFTIPNGPISEWDRAHNSCETVDSSNSRYCGR